MTEGYFDVIKFVQMKTFSHYAPIPPTHTPKQQTTSTTNTQPQNASVTFHPKATPKDL